MESKIDESQKIDSTLIPLLPVYFKKIGVALLIISFLPLTIIKIKHVELGEAQKEMVRYVSMNVFIFGLFLIAWAKDKVEDDQTTAIRVKSLFIAFIFAVVSIVFKPLTDLLFSIPIKDMKGQEVAGTMLFVYLLFYYSQKKGSKMQSARPGL